MSTIITVTFSIYGWIFLCYSITQQLIDLKLIVHALLIMAIAHAPA